MRRSKAAQALPHLREALRLYRDSGNKRGEGAAQDLLGQLFATQGQYSVAAEHYRSGFDAFSEASNSAKESSASSSLGLNSDKYNAELTMGKLGDMFARLGKLSDAKEAYSRLDAAKPDTSAVGQAKGAQSAVRKARGLGSRLRGLASATPSTSTASEVTGSAGDAASLIKQGFDRYHQLIIYSTRELGFGRVDYFNEDLESARSHFQNALDASGGQLPVIGNLSQTRRIRISARTGLGEVALREKRYAAAIGFFGASIKGAEADRRMDLMWAAERGLARAEWMQAAQETAAPKASELRQKSLADYRAALETIQSIREGSLRADEARTSFLASTRDVYEEAVSAFCEMTLGTSESSPVKLDGQSMKYASEAFQINEGGRARSLLDMLSEAKAQVTGGISDELLKKRQENLDRQEEIALQLTGVNYLGTTPEKPVDQLEAELTSLETEYNAIGNQIRLESPQYRELTSPRILTLDDVQTKLLDDATALVEYSLGSDHSYVWAVTRSGAYLYRLPARAVLGSKVSEVRDLIVPVNLRRSLGALTSSESRRGLGVIESPGSVDASKFGNSSNALYGLILKPVATIFGTKRLLVVPEGSLSYLPFSALVTTKPGNNADYSTLQYVAGTNEVVYAPSASVALAVREKKSALNKAGSPVLVVADPIFDPKDPRLNALRKNGDIQNTGPGNPDRGLALDTAIQDLGNGAATQQTNRPFPIPRLEGTRSEAQQISRIARESGFKPDVWLDLEANAGNFETKDLSKYIVLHIATHGLLDTERPQFTGLILSLVGSNSGSGFLRANEIFNLRLSAPVVILSACETGLGKEARGEGVIGLTRAFMYAGAPLVGVTLWSVSDRSTAELMTGFYQRFLGKKGVPAAQALNMAEREMIQGKRYSAPFYWAPFVIAGNWN